MQCHISAFSYYVSGILSWRLYLILIPFPYIIQDPSTLHLPCVLISLLHLFVFLSTQYKIGRGKPQLRKCRHPIWLLGLFSWLNDCCAKPSYCWWCLSWASGPGWYKKASQTSQGENGKFLCSFCSAPTPCSHPTWVLASMVEGMIEMCDLNPLLPKLLFVMLFYHSNRNQTEISWYMPSTLLIFVVFIMDDAYLQLPSDC